MTPALGQGKVFLDYDQAALDRAYDQAHLDRGPGPQPLRAIRDAGQPYGLLGRALLEQMKLA